MSQRRILVIDDCIDTLDLLKTTLESEFEVFGIQDPAKTFDLLEVAEPDAVFLDLMMPGLSGFDILEKVSKGSPALRQTPFIVLSCKKGVEDQKKAYALGAKLYFSKPFDPERLLKLLKMFFENAKLGVRPKSYKLGEIGHVLELRSQFKVSQLARGTAMQKTAMAGSSSSAPAPSDEEDEETKDRKLNHRWVN